MLIVLSPAKTLDLTTPIPSTRSTQPRFIDEAAKLARGAAKLRPSALRKLMHISDGLAELNAARFREFTVPFTSDNARPALYTFDGDVYAGLRGPRMDSETVSFAQDHVRILSGLYGLLRPLDLMQPYRLEMGIKFGVGRAKTIYDFWGDRIGRALADELDGHADQTLINLASVEYFNAVIVDRLPGTIVSIDFREDRDGALRFNTFAAKKARGTMARLICEQRIDRADGVKDIVADGYRFAGVVDDQRWSFVHNVASVMHK